MLQSIRDKTQGWIAKGILGIICITFALWGIHNYFAGVNTSQAAAKVNGATISRQQLSSTLQQIQANQSHTLGNDTKANALLAASQQQQALNQLILQQLLVQQLTNLKLATPDATLQELLEQMPMFQDNGHFSITRYQQVLQTQGLSSAAFVASLKQQIEMTQLQNSIVYSNFALSQDVSTFIQLMNETRKVGYILIPATHFKDEPVSDAVIQAYYDSHQSDFMQPAKVQLAYIELSLANVTDALIKQGLSASQAKAQAQAKYADFSDKLTNLSYEQPTSLDPVAKALDLPIQTTGFFSQHALGSGITMNPKVRAAAFSADVMQQGYNSQVIGLDDGSQVVIRVLNKQAAQVAPLSDVKAQITTILQNQAKQTAANQLANDMLKALSEGQDGQSVAAKYQLDWQMKTAVSRHEPDTNAQVLQQVFNLPSPTSPKGSMTILTLPNGETAVVVVYQVTPGNPALVSQADKDALSRQIAKSLGQVDFALYVQGLRDKANIRVYTANA